MAALTRRSANGGTDSLPKNNDRKQADDQIRQLVTQLVSICEPIPPPRGECLHEEIVLDRNVDGVRYLLVRMPSPVPSLVSLTPREQEIVRMVAKGYPNKTIAGVLNISSWTVCTHLRRTFAKLGVASRAAMVARLLEEGRIWDQMQPNEKPLARPTSSSTATPLQPLDVTVPKRTVPKDALSVAAGQQALARQKPGS